MKFGKLLPALVLGIIISASPLSANAADGATVTYKTTVAQDGGKIGDVDRGVREIAEQSGVTIRWVRSRAAYGWQVSTISVEGSEQDIAEFVAAIEAYKAELKNQ